MGAYASGKYAFGYCDLTGFRYPIKDLVPQIVNGRPTGFLVGKDVNSPDQPQLKLGRIRMDDPQALRSPRPDQGLLESRILSSFDPVGQVGLGMTGNAGIVTIEVSSG
tara:strand:- start:763 stop:1086 length:324 start_codon:yes stop_codon:yes gene_type:complete